MSRIVAKTFMSYRREGERGREGAGGEGGRRKGRREGEREGHYINKLPINRKAAITHMLHHVMKCLLTAQMNLLFECEAKSSQLCMQVPNVKACALEGGVRGARHL